MDYHPSADCDQPDGRIHLGRGRDTEADSTEMTTTELSTFIRDRARDVAGAMDTSWWITGAPVRMRRRPVR